MGLFEKRRARKFFIYVQDYEDNDPKSHEGLDLNKVTARELISCVSHPYFPLKSLLNHLLLIFYFCPRPFGFFHLYMLGSLWLGISFSLWFLGWIYDIFEQLSLLMVINLLHVENMGWKMIQLTLSVMPWHSIVMIAIWISQLWILLREWR